MALFLARALNDSSVPALNLAWFLRLFPVYAYAEGLLNIGARALY